MTENDDARMGEELVRLASADNFRDVAGDGYAGEGGAVLRRGVFFRSNELQLVDDDAHALRDLGIAAIYDLRDLHEVEAHPDVEVAGATWTHLEVQGIPPGAGAELPDAAAAVETMLSIYRRVRDRPRLARVVRGPAARWPRRALPSCSTAPPARTAPAGPARCCST